MDHSLVLYEVNDRVGYITLNRPEKRNALSFEFVQQIKDVFTIAERDDACKVIVLRANGDAFCAGADLAYLQQLQQNTFEENLADSQHLMQLFQHIYYSKKIIIAQVNGPAIAGGSGLATVCDFCFATPESSFGYTEVKIGFVPAIVMVFLVRKVTEKIARQLLLTGNMFAADKALEYGLINEIISAESLPETVSKFAQQLCRQTSSQSVGMVKEMLAKVQQVSLDEGLHYAANMNANARSTDDCKKGIAAFLNKEKLTW
jgi:methylglutaconyl-CoA hydratase